jgi:hypothetical protein
MRRILFLGVLTLSLMSSCGHFGKSCCCKKKKCGDKKQCELKKKKDCKKKKQCPTKAKSGEAES